MSAKQAAEQQGGRTFLSSSEYRTGREKGEVSLELCWEGPGTLGVVLWSEEGVTAEGPVALMNCSKDRNRVKHHGWHWPAHARPQAQQQLCKVFSVAADEVGKAALEYLPLTASFQNALEEKLHADPLILLSSRLQSYPRYRADPSVQNFPPETQVELGMGTHQLFEEGSFLMLLGVALILVQAIL